MHEKIGGFLLDVVQNAIEAGATVVSLDVKEKGSMIEISVGDNGKGMNEEELKSALNPFYSSADKHPRRKIGLGLPFLKQATEAADGSFDIDSRKGEGTSVYFSFNRSHPDCPPIGDLTSCFLSLMLFDKKYDLILSHSKEGDHYSLIKSELEDALGNLSEVECIKLAKQFIESQESEIMPKKTV